MSTIAQLYVEYRRDVNHLFDNVKLIENSYLAPIASSVYKIDTEGLNLLLNGALKLDDIIYLKVEERGEMILLRQKWETLTPGSSFAVSML